MSRKTATPDVITQAEIKSLSDLDLAIQGAVYKFRQRLLAGATVESGGYSLEDEEIAPLEKPFRCNLDLAGLNISVPNAMNPSWARHSEKR